MEMEIRNRVKESGIITLDLANFKPDCKIEGIDIAAQLWQGLVLKEKDFRAWIKETDWSEYSNSAVYIYCSADAIVPTWAYILIASSLKDHAIKIICGSRMELEKSLILDKISSIDTEEFRDGRIIIKGCADIASPEFAMSALTLHLQSSAKSIMYGEPCSTVPIFKRK